MPTYPDPADPVAALTSADGTTRAHSVDHGRVVDIWENVKHHGAKGTDLSDDSGAIQDAIDTAQDAGGGTVYFPMGIYRLDAGITFDTRVRLMGPGTVLDEIANAGMYLHYTPTTGQALTATTENLSGSGPRIENIGLVGSGAGNDTVGICLDGDPGSYGMSRGMLHNVHVRHFGVGIQTIFALSVTFIDNYCIENGTGLELTSQSNACFIFGGAYRQNTIGAHFEDSSTIYINSTVESNSSVGILLDGGVDVLSNQSGIRIHGHCENNPTGVKVDMTSPYGYYACEIEPSVFGSATYGLDLGTLLTSKIAPSITDGTSEVFLRATTSANDVRLQGIGPESTPVLYTDDGVFNKLEYYINREDEDTVTWVRNAGRLATFEYQSPASFIEQVTTDRAISVNGQSIEGPYVGGPTSNLISDTFTRADAAALGTSSGGQAWLLESTATFAIDTNKAKVTVIPGADSAYAYVDTSLIDLVVEADVTLSAGSSAAGVFARGDGTHHAQALLVKLGAVQGVLTLHLDGAVADAQNVTLAQSGTYHLKLTAAKNTLVVNLDDVDVITYTLAGAERTDYDGTRAGITAYVSGEDKGSRWDNFVASGIAAGIGANGQLVAPYGFQTGRAAHGSLPVATGFLAGTSYYCSSDKQPIWSDGTNWVEADGTNH